MTILRTGLHGHSGPGVIPGPAMGGGAGALGPAGGWWDDFGSITCAWAAYQPKGAASLAASYIDLTGNGNNCGPGVAPGWNAVNGWIFNATNQWLDTSFIPQIDQSQSMLMQFTNYTSVGVEMAMGVRTGGGDYLIAPNYTGSILRGNGGNISVAPGLLIGNIGVAGSQGYRNGVAEGAPFGAWGAGGAFSVYIGCWNQTGAPLRFCATYIQAVSLYDCTLTPAEVAAVAAWMPGL